MALASLFSPTATTRGRSACLAGPIMQNKANLRRGQVNAKSLSGKGLGEAMTGYAAAKTKPIPGVEIASSVSDLLAMTSARRAIGMGALLQAGGQQLCKTKPIWTDGRKREVLCEKRVTDITGAPLAIQNKANFARTGPVVSGETYAWGHRASLL
jgi:hypothetical protein